MAEGADKEEIKALAPSKRNLYAVIPLGIKDVEEKIHIWNTTDYFVQECINQELEENEDMASFPDLEDGFSLNFRFEEESFAGKPYFKPSRLDFEEREAYDEEILEDVPELDKCLTVLSYNELTALLFQIEPEDVDDEEAEEEKPTRRKKVVEEDEEEEEKPARRKKTVEKEDDEEKPIRRSKKPEPEPEPEEDEEDADEIPEGFEVCPDCGGTGTTKKGRKCPTCDGEGIVEISEDDNDDEEDAPPPKKKNNAKAQEFVDAAKERGVKFDDDDDDDEEEKPKAKSGKGKCPFGHEFGKDNDAYPKDCKKCDMWDECFDAE